MRLTISRGQVEALLERLWRTLGQPRRHAHNRDHAIEVYFELLRDEEHVSVERAIDALCRMDLSRFPSPARVRDLARQNRPYRASEAALSGDPEPCEVCGEPYEWWRILREDQSTYDRFLIRHVGGLKCARYNGRREFVRIAPDPRSAAARGENADENPESVPALATPALALPDGWVGAEVLDTGEELTP